jgi:hypothetical protein
MVSTAASIDNKAMVPKFCSTECAAEAATKWMSTSTPAAAPTSHTVTEDVIPVLTAAAAGYGTLLKEHIKGAASTAVTSLSGSPSSNV